MKTVTLITKTTKLSTLRQYHHPQTHIPQFIRTVLVVTVVTTFTVIAVVIVILNIRTLRRGVALVPLIAVAQQVLARVLVAVQWSILKTTRCVQIVIAFLMRSTWRWLRNSGNALEKYEWILGGKLVPILTPINYVCFWFVSRTKICNFLLK